jgi:hypothetical protein
MAGAFEGQNGFLTNEFLVLKNVNPASFAKKKVGMCFLFWQNPIYKKTHMI